MSSIQLLIPESSAHLGGPFVTATEGFEILARRDRTTIVEFHERPQGIGWFEDFDFMYCQQQHEPNVYKVIRKATDDEIKAFRIPIWIQSDESPQCCGKAMHFVGQIDDSHLCTERPPDAKMWWHDAASFYVFTCPQCLECKAVGQQF